MATVNPPPWKLPASDPMEGSSADIINNIRCQLAVGQQWAIGEHCAFKIQMLTQEDAWGLLRCYDGNGVFRWERPHYFWFGYFAGLMRDQERRPVLWQPVVVSVSVSDDEDDPTVLRARALEV